MQFLKLTGELAGATEPVYVSPHDISMIQPFNGGSTIFIGATPVAVLESPDDVMYLIEAAQTSEGETVIELESMAPKPKPLTTVPKRV